MGLKTTAIFKNLDIVKIHKNTHSYKMRTFGKEKLKLVPCTYFSLFCCKNFLFGLKVVPFL